MVKMSCEDGSIVKWEIHNIDNFTQSRSFKAHDSSVIRLKSVDNLKLISSSYKNNIIKVWDSITFDCIKRAITDNFFLYFCLTK